MAVYKHVKSSTVETTRLHLLPRSTQMMMILIFSSDDDIVNFKFNMFVFHGTVVMEEIGSSDKCVTRIKQLSR